MRLNSQTEEGDSSSFLTNAIFGRTWSRVLVFEERKSDHNCTCIKSTGVKCDSMANSKNNLQNSLQKKLLSV